MAEIIAQLMEFQNEDDIIQLSKRMCVHLPTYMYHLSHTYTPIFVLNMESLHPTHVHVTTFVITYFIMKSNTDLLSKQLPLLALQSWWRIKPIIKYLIGLHWQKG